jgi:hypothetical protein
MQFWSNVYLTNYYSVSIPQYQGKFYEFVTYEHSELLITILCIKYHVVCSSYITSMF